jgi:signal transduction histidine kinase
LQCVEVRDTGVGIAPEDHQKVFAAFQQADTSYTRAQEGTGLGLAVARQIALSHGGRITAGNAEGRGAQFCLELPTTLPEGAS